MDAPTRSHEIPASSDRIEIRGAADAERVEVMSCPPPDRAGTKITRHAMETWDVPSLEIEPHRPQVLSSEEETRVIAIQLPSGEELQEHQTHERSLLIVVEGEIEVTQGGETIAGGPGFLAQCKPNERREVRATADARLVLVLAPWPGEGHPSRRP